MIPVVPVSPVSTIASSKSVPIFRVVFLLGVAQIPDLFGGVWLVFVLPYLFLGHHGLNRFELDLLLDVQLVELVPVGEGVVRQVGIQVQLVPVPVVLELCSLALVGIGITAIVSKVIIVVRQSNPLFLLLILGYFIWHEGAKGNV